MLNLKIKQLPCKNEADFFPKVQSHFLLSCW